MTIPSLTNMAFLIPRCFVESPPAENVARLEYQEAEKVV
jgi:hypothetical protein